MYTQTTGAQRLHEVGEWIPSNKEIYIAQNRNISYAQAHESAIRTMLNVLFILAQPNVPQCWILEKTNNCVHNGRLIDAATGARRGDMSPVRHLTSHLVTCQSSVELNIAPGIVSRTGHGDSSVSPSLYATCQKELFSYVTRAASAIVRALLVMQDVSWASTDLRNSRTGTVGTAQL